MRHFNDGIVSTASLIVGVAAAAATQNDVLLAGIAGLVAGAMSMAAGEYVSVSSQSDTEQADLARERKELREDVESEREELAGIYVERGVDKVLARQVAEQLMAKDALMAHARDELGRGAMVEQGEPAGDHDHITEAGADCRDQRVNRLRSNTYRPDRPFVA